ncbi:TolC family protein [Olivibacter sitiensis]|uniref:TolC family protein n=1 Tax=Olivibacter sitiensis TaxID=376470 RepID=UPI00055F2E38|nr:TolC family protein [Olivibacter sitiensis]
MFLHYTKTFVLSVCFSLCFVYVNAQEPKVVTLQEAIKQALDNNLQVKQAAFQESLSEQDVLQAKMNILPSISSSISSSKNWGLLFDQTAGVLVNSTVTSAGASASGNLVLFSGFQRVNQIKMNKYQLLADESNVEKVKNDLVLSVATKYLEALTNHDLMVAAQQQVKLSSEQVEVQQANYDVGNNTLADLSQAKSQLATDELSLTTAQNGYEISVLDLKQLMEMDPKIRIELQKPALPNVEKLTSSYDAESVYESAVDDYPDIILAKFNSMVAKKNVDVNRGGFYPQLSIGAGYGTNYSSQAQRVVSRDPLIMELIPFGQQLDQNRNRNVFASLSIPVFDNYRRTINYRKAKISYNNALNNERLAKNNLNKIINQAVLDLRAAEKRYYSTEQAFTSAKDAFEVTKERYDVGMSNAVELATQQTAMNKAEFDFIQAKYDFIFRSKVIDFYLGRTIAFD